VRVIPRRPGRRDERGAIAVIVALCSIVIFGFAAYAIDAGHLWQERRQGVTATDSAALAAAADYAAGRNGCSSTAAAYTAANQSDASIIGCSASVNPTSGHVTVSTKVNVDYFFGQIFGGDTSHAITTRTTAQWGIPKSVSGLRPFGLCIEANQPLKNWLANPVGTSGTVRITYGKDQPNACGANVPGNWGVQDFDGGANSNSDTMSWTLNGYPGTVSVGANIPGDTGAFSNSLDSGLSFLKSSG
jgi:Flp pilus assembly protein TadG